MSFEKDILISYAHIDDESLVEGEKGWISEFHRSLEIRLAQLLGAKPHIWRDPKLSGNDYFGDEIVDQFPSVATLVSVVSPRYLKSEWCNREVKEFVRASQSNVGIRVGNKSRIFKVIKTPVSLEEQMTEFKDILGYEFFSIDPRSGRAREFGKIFGKEQELAYWAKLDDLAHDLCELIESIRSGQGIATPSVDGKTIYLAPNSLMASGEDFKRHYEGIKRELQELGHRVLPDRQLPFIADEMKEYLAETLPSCDLIVHPLGNSFGMVPDGTTLSTTGLQCEAAATIAASHGIPRYIWLPPGMKPEDQRQEQFLQEVKVGSAFSQGAEVFETPLEVLKDSLRDELNKKSSEPEQAVEGEGEEDLPPVVYLICNQEDMDEVAALDDYLYDQGFDVILPVFEGEESDIRSDHMENLKTCDAAIIFYGKGNELWLRSKMRDLLKIAGYGRTKSHFHKAVYMAPPADRSKDRFRARGVEVINGINGFAQEELDQFIAQFKPSGPHV